MPPVVLAGLMMLGACSDTPESASPLPRQTETTDDACDVFITRTAEKILGVNPDQEGYESGIGPGCVYNLGRKRVGMNLLTKKIKNVRDWKQSVVDANVVALKQTTDVTVEPEGQLGDAAVWVVGEGVHVLFVFADGRAFDIYLELGPSATDGETLEAARKVAESVIKQLASEN